MFDEVNYTKDSASILEERELLQQLVSLGVGYPHGRPWFSKAAITDTNTLQCQTSRLIRSQKYLDAGSIIQEVKDHIRRGDDGYYMIDLHKGRILANGQHPIEDIIIDFTLSGTDDRILLRRRKGTCFHGTGFFIVPDAVYFLEINGVCIPVKEFHVLSFLRLNDTSKSGLVMDYNAAQNNRPLVLFPHRENNDIIQAQLNHDDHCLYEQFESLFRGNGSAWNKI